MDRWKVTEDRQGYGSFVPYGEMDCKTGGNAFSPLVISLSVEEQGGSHGIPTAIPITTTRPQKRYLISFYVQLYPSLQNIQKPTNDPVLNHIRLTKGMCPESKVYEPPNVSVIAISPLFTRE
ncbi:Gluconate transport-inducing protein [Rhizina undulata]